MRKKKAFTIVELVIVIAVVAILMAAGFIGGNQMTGRSRDVALEAQLKNMSDAVSSMLTDYPRLGLMTSLSDEDYETDVSNRVYIVNLLNTYLDQECSFFMVGNDICSSVNDPYGNPYHLGMSVVKAKTLEDGAVSAEIRFFIKSAGKNKQTPANVTHATDVAAMNADLDDIILMIECVSNEIRNVNISDIVIDPTATPPATANEGDVVFGGYSAEAKTVLLNGAHTVD